MKPEALRRAIGVLVGTLAFWLAGRGTSLGVDFIRGDANDDGVVTFADGHGILNFLFRTGEGVTCGDAADTNNDGRISVVDAILVLRHLTQGGEDPAPPFPNLGPDDGFEQDIDERWPCDSYGQGTPLSDANASLRVLDAVALGGAQRHVAIRLALSNSSRVAGYYAELDTAGVIAERNLDENELNDGVFDLSQTFARGFLEVSSVGSKLKVGYLSSIIADTAIPPREQRQLVLEINLCLEPGTAAGDYPLVLETGELVDFESGRRIEPLLIPGRLTVLEDVVESECVIERSEPGIETFLNIRFKLGETSGAPGSEVEIPFFVRTSDHADTRGLRFSVDFDEEVLQLTGVETVLKRPGGKPWRFETFFVNNENENPGSVGIDEGFVTGHYTYGTLSEPQIRFPMNEEFTALKLRFRIQPQAAVGTTEVRFEDGGEFCRVRPSREGMFCSLTRNEIISGQVGLPPELVNSFVFVNGRVHIIGEVTTFIRGDSNGDRTVDISDARFTLDYLFLGGRTPNCLDAADSNDDGRLDVSDAITVLASLFLGAGPLPPPISPPGEDPTPDALHCIFGTLS